MIPRPFAHAAAVCALAALGLPAMAAVQGHFPGASDTSLLSSQVLTAAQAAALLGAPDDSFIGLGAQWVTYDLQDFRLVDGPGQDLNVYEVDNGIVEFQLVDILVSADNLNFFNIEATSAAAVALVGDSAHGNANFRRSYDLGGAVLALGASEFRYVRIAGTGSGALTGNNGFDLDAIGLVNFVAPPIPEPSAWALMTAGLAALGAVARRRRSQAAG